MDHLSLRNDQQRMRATPGIVWQVVGGVIPLMVVVMGIGTMSIAPRKSSLRLFPSAKEARSFYESNHLSFSFNQPLVLVESNCSACDELTNSLQQLQIPFIEGNIERTPSVLALRRHAGRLAGSSTLPMVILGDQLIDPSPNSVKVALRQLRKQ